MIKNILFDLGAVILEISLENYVETLREISPNTRFEFDHKKHAFYNDFEKGLIDEELFFRKMQGALDGVVSIKDLKKAWSTILLEPYEQSRSFLDRVQANYNLYLLSNTNIAHQNQFDSIFNKNWGKDVFYSYFKQVFYSFKMGLIKPDLEIFNKVLNDANIDASETLFIDDNAGNIKTANELGFRTWLFNGPNDWLELTDHFKIK